MEVKIANFFHFYRKMNVATSQWLGGKVVGRKRRNFIAQEEEEGENAKLEHVSKIYGSLKTCVNI